MINLRCVLTGHRWKHFGNSHYDYRRCERCSRWQEYSLFGQSWYIIDPPRHHLSIYPKPGPSPHDGPLRHSEL